MVFITVWKTIIRKMASIRPHETCQSILVRFLFLCHGTLTFVMFFGYSPAPKYWLITIPLVLLVFDMALRYDCKYIWVSAIFYISSLLPIVWCVELELLESRIEKRDCNHSAHAPLPTKGTVTNEHGTVTIFNLSNEIVAKKLCEIGLVVGLIIGRAMAPRGVMSHDQLSSLLLGFVSNSADIIGVFDTFSHETIIYSRTVTHIVLGCFTWSIYQFTFIPYSTTCPKEKVEAKQQPKKIKPKRRTKREPSSENLFRQDTDKNAVRTYGSTEMLIQDSAKNQKKRKFCNIEVVSNLVLLLMHDGPFFILRAVLIFSYNVMSEIHIFFTIKNGMVVLLLVYRLCSLCCCNEDEVEDGSSKTEYNTV